MPLHTYYSGSNPKHWQYQIPTRIWGDRNCDVLLIGMKNCATLEDILVTSYKAKDNIAQ
jgi:hypothetical protein